MNYSVYNPSTRAFDYYQTSELAGVTHAGAPPKSILASSLGASPEQAAWTLPMSARKVGSGPVARGRVATKGALVPFAGFADAPLPLIVLAIGGAYFWWRNRR